MDTIDMPQARYKQVVDRIAADIRAGNIAPGTRLPTHRQLSAMKGIALVTATRVYAELEQMGLVSGERGRGTFVRESAVPDGHGADQHPVAPDMIDLTFNYGVLPQQSDHLRNALRQLAGGGEVETLLRYQPHEGRLHERRVITDYLASQGVNTSSEQVMIVSGAQHGLSLAVMSLLRPGDVIAVDALTYPGIKVVADAFRVELVPIPALDHGPDLSALNEICQARTVRALYVIPTLHNPLGWVLDLAQRKELVSIARKYDLCIIEDAAYAFLAENSPVPLAALAPERTVYVSGVSKSIATGLRVGFLSAPSEWVPAIRRSIRATTWNTPPVMTAIVCKWLTDGSIQWLEEEKRKDAEKRQAIARKALKGLNYKAHPASYFVWISLPQNVRADQLVMDLARQNISISTAEPFAVSKDVPHAIRLALGSVDLSLLPDALIKVRKAIEERALY
ncbi:MAG: DNA-binding transcriptional MocR family regulator [Sneathiella sp.]|jgi:DNA-binding transcriptional MocR family regulator